LRPCACHGCACHGRGCRGPFIQDCGGEECHDPQAYRTRDQRPWHPAFALSSHVFPNLVTRSSFSAHIHPRHPHPKHGAIDYSSIGISGQTL
jgi:hypothetical protein